MTSPALAARRGLLKSHTSTAIAWALALESSDITGLADNDPVATWTGSAGNATQATGANQPLYKTAILNGQPIVRFDGSNDVLATNLSNTSTAFTLMFVGKYRTASTNRAIAFSGNVGIIADGTNWAWYRNSASGIQNFGGTATNFSIVALVFASTSSCVTYVNGVAGSAWNPGSGYTATGLPLVLGANGTGGGEPGAVDLAAVFVIKEALSAPARAAHETYLAAKYGISI